MTPRRWLPLLASSCFLLLLLEAGAIGGKCEQQISVTTTTPSSKNDTSNNKVEISMSTNKTSDNININNNNTNVNTTTPTTTTTTSAPTTSEALSEQLVKQSNLQAEESQPAASFSVLPPPSSAANDGGATGPQRSSANAPEAPASFTGGSGNSYMSISRDGSNRYEFGFDTNGAREQQQQQANSTNNNNNNNNNNNANVLLDLDPDTLPSSMKKEGPDWMTMFNPKVKKVLDVGLVHTLVHDRHASLS